jgi:hypothetical protein
MSRESALIDRLATGLQPVKPLASPWLRALLWLGAIVVLAVWYAMGADLALVRGRITGAPDAVLSVAGSVLTCILAAIAGFELSLPDRRDGWMLLPLPGVALWLGASGLGCLRQVLIPTMEVPDMHGSMECLTFILELSIPLSALLIWMLRKAHPLRPGRVAAMAGLAAAAGSASLLWFDHPYDASAVDLATHVVAVLAVVGINRVLGGRLLG